MSEIPIYSGTYENISRGYQRLHWLYYAGVKKMGLTHQQARDMQRQVAKTYAIVSGIPPLRS